MRPEKISNFRKIVISLGCAVAMFAAGAQAATYKMATNTSENDGSGVLLNEFVRDVAEKTDGRVRIKIFFNGVLGDQMAYLQQIPKGVIDMALVNSGALENVIPEFGVVNLPYVFRTADEYRDVMSDPAVKQMLFEGAASHHFAPLGYISNGFRGLFVNQEVNGIDDLAGLKIRTMTSETYIEMLERFGAVPTPMSYTDVFPALQQGVIDGAEGGLGGLWTQKFGEVAPWALRTDQTRLTDFVIMSEKFQERVGPEDLQIVVDEFAKLSEKSVDFIEERIRSNEQKAVDELGVTFVEVDTGPFIEAVRPMLREAAEDEQKGPLLEAIFEIENRQF